MQSQLCFRARCQIPIPIGFIFHDWRSKVQICSALVMQRSHISSERTNACLSLYMKLLLNGWPNSLIWTIPCFQFICCRIENDICPNCLILADQQLGREAKVPNCLIWDLGRNKGCIRQGMKAKKPMKRKGIQRVCKSKCTLQEGTKNVRRTSWVGRWGCRNVVSFKAKGDETSTRKATHWSMTNSLVSHLYITHY